MAIFIPMPNDLFIHIVWLYVVMTTVTLTDSTQHDQYHIQNNRYQYKYNDIA